MSLRGSRCLAAFITIAALAGSAIADGFAEGTAKPEKVDPQKPACMPACAKTPPSRPPPMRPGPPQSTQKHGSITQNNYVNCGPAIAATSPASAASAQSTEAPKAASAPEKVASAQVEACLGRIEVKLGKDAGISWVTGDKGISWFAAIVAAVLAGAGLWLGAAAIHKRGEATPNSGSGSSWFLGAGALLAMAVFGGLVGYSMNSDTQATLDDTQVRQLAESVAFRKELAAQAMEETSRLRQQVAQLEKDLAVAQTEVKAEASSHLERRGDWLTSGTLLVAFMSVIALLAFLSLSMLRQREQRYAGVLGLDREDQGLQTVVRAALAVLGGQAPMRSLTPRASAWSVACSGEPLIGKRSLGLERSGAAYLEPGELRHQPLGWSASYKQRRLIISSRLLYLSEKRAIFRT